MGQQLTDSLQRQWQLEQQRTEQVAALAHDLKTPLTIIQGNAELLAESADTTAPELDAILRAGDRAQQYLAAPAQCGHGARRPPAYRQPCLCCRAGGYGQRPLPPGEAPLCFAGAMAGPVSLRRPELSRARKHAGQRRALYSRRWHRHAGYQQARGHTGFHCHRYRPRLHARSPAQGRAVPHTDAARPGNGHQGLGLYLARSVARAYGGKLVLANTDIGRRCSFACPCNKR